MDETMNATGPNCSIQSRLAHEPLIGSAPLTDFWVLLEYPHPMSAKALQENQLPDDIKDHLTALQSNISNTRVLLIRQQKTPTASRPVLYLADGRDEHLLLHKFLLASYAELLTLNIPAILTGSVESPGSVCNESVILVCTNGKRDACCAKWGLPLLRSLEKREGKQVWQASHVGGHRFAPNLICLPHGIYYGRVLLEEAAWVVDRYLNGQLSLKYYRGKAAYPPPVQAAEYFLRRETGDDRIGIYRLEMLTATSTNQWEISFTDMQAKITYQVTIESQPTGMEIFESCNAPTERKAVKEFRLLQPIRACG